jgi:hypothetical protein
MISKEKIITFCLFVFVAFALNFFQASFAIDINSSFRYLITAVIMTGVLISIPFIFIADKGLTPAIQLMCITILFSFYMAKISWGQSYMESLKTTYPYFLWFTYFGLLHFKYPLKKIENIIVIYGIIYILLFTFQFLNPGTVYFGYKKVFSQDRGITRIDFPGGGVFYLTIFIALTRFREYTKYKTFWLGIIVVGLIVVILQVTRQNIAAVILVYVFHFMRNQPLYKKFLVALLSISAILVVLSSDNPIVDGIINIKDRRNQLSDNNARIQTADYYLNRYSPYTYNMFLGNGVPYTSKSDYGMFEENLNKKGYYFDDVGLISIFVMFGPLAVLAYLILFVKSFRLKIPKEYVYLKYYVFYLLMSCLTSASVLSVNFLIANIFVFYSLQFLYKERKEKKLLAVVNYDVSTNE